DTLVGLDYSMGPNPKLVSYNLKLKSEKQVCQDIPGTILSVGSIEVGKTFVFAQQLGSTTHEWIYSMYLFDHNQCHLVNSFPSRSPNIGQLVLTTKGLLVLLINPDITGLVG